ncbi:MAG TPA: terminase large subunit [Gaiellaceae bacterium]|nr:terminase large subunit [Gaiellaceae bacterium]
MSAAVVEREASASVECRCPACESGLDPFTVDHFRVWAAELELDSGERWDVDAFFAAYLEDYFARVPECWLIVPEGNGKTTSLAGLALYLLEHRANASIPWAASSRDQAEIGYRQAEGLVLRSRRLRSFLKCQEGYRRIKNLLTGGRMQVFAADDKTGDGVIPTDAFLDELHRHKDLRLYRTWRGKLEKRGGQMGTISTAGEPGSEFEETRTLIRQSTPVVERRPGFVHCRSEAIALHEHALEEGANVEDMAAVKLANPSPRITVEKLERKRQSPTMTVEHWRRFVCNLATRGANAAVQEAEWDRWRVNRDRDEWLEIPAGEARWVGLDVAWKWDTTALVPLWIPEPSFRLFGRATILTPPRDGTSLDPGLVEQALLAEHERGPIHTVVMDMTRAEQLAAWIQDELGAEVVDRSQGNAMAVMDYERFMEALRNGWLRHVGDPGLSRHVLNAVARQLPGGDTRFDRPQASRLGRRGQQDTRVIDALTAAAMVHTTAAAELGADDDDDLGAYVVDLDEAQAA